MKKIKGFKWYYIDEKGNVYSDRSGKLTKLKPYKCRNGYLNIRLEEECGNRPHKLIHRLVAEAFVVNKLNLPEVNHIDGNKENNYKENLEWVSRKDNINHSMYNLEHSSVHNHTSCELYVDDKFVKSCVSVKEACEFARDNFNASFSSLYKYKKAHNIEIREINEKCNDYPVARSTVEDELPLKAHCILF